jgi:hypothetical protein
MANPRAVDSEGKPIDPSADLKGFLAKVAAPQQGEPAPEAPAAPSYRTFVFADAEDEELKGKTGEEVAKIFADRRTEVTRERDRATQLQRELESERQTRQMEDIARRVMPVQPAAPAPEPREDPRVAKMNEAWAAGDFESARALFNEITRDDVKNEVRSSRDEVKAEITAELRGRRVNEDAQGAYLALRNHLGTLGIPGEVVDARSRALLAEVTYNGSPFYANGSLTNPRNLLAAWNHLWPASAAPTAPPAPVAAQPSQPTPPTPPGSSRPAPAAAPGAPSKGTLSDAQRRAREYIAPRLGLKVDDLIERGKRRNANA